MATALHSNSSILSMGGSRSPCSRHIRFAPLPDPRRCVLITDEGNELPVFQSPSATQFPAPPTPSPIYEDSDYFDSESDSSSSLALSPSSSMSSTPGTATPSSADGTIPSPDSVSNRLSSLASAKKPKSKVSAFFKSLKLGSSSNSSSPSSPSNSLTPTQSNEPAPHTAKRLNHRHTPRPSIPSIYTTDLPHVHAAEFRSLDPNESESSSRILHLSRWSSAGSHKEHSRSTWGIPLGRVSSTQSFQSKTKPPDTPTSPSQRPSYGRRMPNGRVYGQNRQKERERQLRNPFDNIPETESKFIMWGYGGMGSVKSVTSNELKDRWERLYGQGGSQLQSTVDPDDDDGDGIAWVRRRREKREREAVLKKEMQMLEQTIAIVENEEKEIREKAAASESATSSSPVSSPSGTSIISPSASMKSPSASVISPSASVISPSASVMSPSSSMGSTEEHVTRAVNVPAPQRYHRSLHHARASKDGLSEAIEATVQKEPRSSESESESDVERDEDEDEEEKEEAIRKTSLGAGVEKISRQL